MKYSWIALLLCIYIVLGHFQVQGCPNGCTCAKRNVHCYGSDGFSYFRSNDPSFVSAKKLTINCANWFNISTLDLADFIQHSDLLELSIEHCGIQEVRSSVSLPVRLILEKLTLSNNKIKEIQREIFQILPFLSSLNLAHNEIQEIGYSAFDGLRLLRSVLLNNNKIRRIQAYAFRGLNLTQLSLSGNRQLRVLDNKTFSDGNVTELHINMVDLTGAIRPALRPLKSGLRNLYWSHCARPLTIEEDFFRGFYFDEVYLMNNTLLDAFFIKYLRTKTLYMQYNALLDVDFSEAPRNNPLEFLHLSFNMIQNIAGTRLSRLENLRELHLNNNQIPTLVGSMLLTLKNLTTLGLANNQISEVPRDAFRDLTLSSLDLSGNTIRTIDGDMFNPKWYMTHLDLAHNRIQTLPGNMENVLSKTLVFDLSGNPLHCNCELKWLSKFNTAHLVHSRMHCETPIFSDVALLHESDFKCDAPKINIVSGNFEVEDTVFLLCNATGDPAPKIEWHSPKDEIINQTEASKNRSVFYTVGVVRLPARKYTFGGVYTCYASNVVYTTTSKVYVLPSLASKRTARNESQITIKSYNFTKIIHSQRKDLFNHSFSISDVIAAVLGTVVGLLVIFACFLLVLYFHRKDRKKKSERRRRRMANEFEHTNCIDLLQLDNPNPLLSPIHTPRRKKKPPPKWHFSQAGPL